MCFFELYDTINRKTKLRRNYLFKSCTSIYFFITNINSIIYIPN